MDKKGGNRLVYWNGDLIPESEARVSIYDSALMFGDVIFEIDVIDPFGNRAAQQHQPLLFGAGPFAAVALAATSHHYRRRPVDQQSLEIDVAVDVIEPQLHQLGTLLHQVAVLGDHVAMAAACNADTNHGCDGY